MSEERKRPIRSFVKRQGRITPGQKAALESLMQQFGLHSGDDVWDWAKVFGRTAPVALEIGCGNGDALIEMAQANPEIDFVGIEVYAPGIGRILAKIEQHQLSNVRVVMHDAVEVLEHNVADNSLDKVMIYFPDPWHKKRHHKRRLIQPNFIALVIKKLKANAELHLATDWENYAEQMLAVCNQSQGITNQSKTNTYVPRPTLRPKTKFEQRGESLGHGVWDLIYQKQ